MIVNYTQEGWQIITQRAHGLLAGQLGVQWRFEEPVERWMETLLAIAEHDDAEVELDGENLLTEQGGPLNYAMKKFDLDHCTKLSQFSIAKSRYIALLTSLHMEFLHKREEADNPDVKDFLDNQRLLQAEWMQELGLTKEEVDRRYSLLEWCDAFSLLLCKQEVQPENRSIEISAGPDGTKYKLYQVEDDKLTIVPWPFTAKSFKVYYESRLIAQLQFETSADFRKAFNDAKVAETVWELVETEVPETGKKV